MEETLRYHSRHRAKYGFSSHVMSCVYLLFKRTVLLSFQVTGRDSAEPMFSSLQKPIQKPDSLLWVEVFRLYCILRIVCF